MPVLNHFEIFERTSNEFSLLLSQRFNISIVEHTTSTKREPPQSTYMYLRIRKRFPELTKKKSFDEKERKFGTYRTGSKEIDVLIPRKYFTACNNFSPFSPALLFSPMEYFSYAVQDRKEKKEKQKRGNEEHRTSNKIE